MQKFDLLLIKRAFFIITLLSVLGYSGMGQSPIIYNQVILDQPVNDLIYSSANRRLYASVPSTGGIYGNHVIEINPFTKQIVRWVFVGSEPNKLAVSDDGQFLYVGLDGSATIRRVLLAGMTQDIVFGLGSGSFGLLFPEDIVVLPGEPHVIAVSRRNMCCSPRHEGVAIYDNGVRRTTVTPGHTGSNVIEPGATNDVLYGYNNETTDFGFRRMNVGPSGVAIATNLQGAISGFGVDIKYSGGVIYSTTGRIVDPINNTLVGTFSIQGSTNGLAVDDMSRRAFFLQGSILRSFNTETFQPVNSLTLPFTTNTSSKLSRWGRRGFALRTSANQIAIFETSLVPSQPNTSDFDGDEKADLAVFRPAGGFWFATSGLAYFQFGLSTDTPVAADYDGDGKTDIAVFRNGIWYSVLSSNNTVRSVQFGTENDVPTPADFDGDHKADLAIYRAGVWWVLNSANGQTHAIQFGLDSDIPVPSDYDGDGKADVAVFRPESGVWFSLSSSMGQLRATQFGSASGHPTPADYDGDGRSDIAILQNAFGQPIYYILRSSDNSIVQLPLTLDESALPFPLDIDGDLIADPVVFEPSGNWIGRRSSTGEIFTTQFGSSGDRLIR